MSTTVPDVGETLVILVVSYENAASDVPTMLASVILTVLLSPMPIPERLTVDESDRQIECSEEESPKRTL